MDWGQYRVRVETMAAGLRGDPRFRSVAEVYPPFSPADFGDMTVSIAEQGLGDFEIWTGFREFYGTLDGFRLQWQFLGDGAASTKTGSVQLSALGAIYMPEDAPPDSVTRMYSEPRIFDLVGPDDHVAVRLHPGQKPPDLLYFADATHRYHPLSVNFESYLDLLLEARAMYRWQQFFVADAEFPLSKTQAAEFRQSLKFLFPEADAKRFTSPHER